MLPYKKISTPRYKFLNTLPVTNLEIILGIMRSFLREFNHLSYFHGQMQKKFLFVIVLMVVLIGQTLAAVPIIHVSSRPNWILPDKPYNKKPLLRNITGGAYNELVEEQINVEKHATYNHFITQIISESGVQNNSEISVSFNPSYEQLDFHEITVWRNNRPQSRLHLNSFKILAEENELEKFIYNGTYSAKYILDDIQKGDKVEYSYTITGINPIFNNKFCRNIYFQGSDPILHQFTTLLLAADRKINIKSFNLLSQPKIFNAEGLKTYEWEDFQVPGVSTDKHQVKWVNRYARVQVSEYANWNEVVNWGLSINPLQTTFASNLADTVAKLKKAFGQNKVDYFRAAVTLVQDEVRYMGIETGQYSHKANSPDRVFKQRYGDCKDKSLLLASILNANGIEAHLVLVNTDLQDKIDNFIPSPVLFNHTVVMAIINDKQIWIDATIGYQGGNGADIYFPPYGEGLVLKAGNAGLTKIKQSKAGKIVYKEKYKITDEHMPVKLIVTTTYTLNEADEIRDHFASTGIAETEKNYRDYYAKTYSKIEVSDPLIIKDNKEKNELTTVENYTIINFFKRDSINKKYTADFYADYISDQLPQITDQTKTPVSVNYPCTIDYTVDIDMPNGWDIANEHYKLERNAYKFSCDKKVADDRLSLHYQFAYFQNYIAADNLSEFKQDVKDLKDDKLSFSFFYIPNVKIVPFQLNQLMLIITLLMICIFVYWGVKVYRTETIDLQYYTKNPFPPALGGWIIVLILTLFATSLGIIKNLFDEGYYSLSKWNQFTTGVTSTANRVLLIFETTGYLVLVCYSIFCLILIFKKRDIATHFVKNYYLVMVIFLFIDYFFNAFIKGEFSNYDVEQIIKAVIIASLWTYYLNVSNRVKETFVVPYHG
jgi:transglutaminase-like putative cysteine protease